VRERHLDEADALALAARRHYAAEAILVDAPADDPARVAVDATNEHVVVVDEVGDPRDALAGGRLLEVFEGAATARVVQPERIAVREDEGLGPVVDRLERAERGSEAVVDDVDVEVAVVARGRVVDRDRVGARYDGGHRESAAVVEAVVLVGE